MQRIELRLVFYPEDRQWRLYSGGTYHTIAIDLQGLHSAIIGTLCGESEDIRKMAEKIKTNNQIAKE